MRRWWRPVLAVVGILLAALFFSVARRALGLVQHPSWPPGNSAITAAGAERAAELFRGDPPDVGRPYAWSTAATIEPWPDSADFFAKIFADVRAATSSVHVIMYGWREGTIGNAFTDLLIQKLQQGVQVRVVVDSQGSHVFSSAKPMFERLARAGAQIVVNDLFPLDEEGLFPQQRSFDWRQDDLGRAEHRKLYVIDGKVAWLGGAGIEDHFQNGKFHDVMARVTGDVVRQAQAVFLMSFRAHGGPLPNDLAPYFPAPADPRTIPVALLQTTPGGFQSATQAMRELIDHAQSRLDVMNPYFTDADMIGRIEAAARRGVAVRVVVSRTSNNAPATYALKHHYRDLLAAGVHVYEYPGAVVHAKVIVADDTALFGTVNLDAWALYRNYEVAVMARDTKTAALFEERLFDPDVARSYPAKLDTGVGRLRDWLWNTLSYFL